MIKKRHKEQLFIKIIYYLYGITPNQTSLISWVSPMFYSHTHTHEELTLKHDDVTLS